MDSTTDFNKICYRAVINFLTLKSVQPQQIHSQMTVIYGEEVPSYATVNRWAAEFCRGRKSLEDEPRLGRASEAVCEENRRAVENAGSLRSPILGGRGRHPPTTVR